ncbi:hypothetical protein [Azonexus sp.]|uniref:hypothetical protein n=1 Tax=Azonexus sp. TaxID=1872668 RepID=UPI0035AE982A
MPLHFIVKMFAAWCAMLLVSVANGGLRELTYGRHVDELTAHQLSTATGIVLLGLVMRAAISRWPPPSRRSAVLLGAGWAALTVAFEFLFFHFVAGHSWLALLDNYNIGAGRIWVFVVLWVAIAPSLFFRCRRSG